MQLPERCDVSSTYSADTRWRDHAAVRRQQSRAFSCAEVLQPYLLGACTTVPQLREAADQQPGNAACWCLQEDKMQGVPLLVLANKQDLINALPAPEVTGLSLPASL